MAVANDGIDGLVIPGVLVQPRQDRRSQAWPAQVKTEQPAVVADYKRAHVDSLLRCPVLIRALTFLLPAARAAWVGATRLAVSPIDLGLRQFLFESSLLAGALRDCSLKCADGGK